MIIEIKQDEIVISNPETFNARHILDSGQVFRYRDRGEYYELIAGDKRCLIYTYDDHIVIKTRDTDYFYRYFDLDTDYEAIIDRLNNEYSLREITSYGRGIRILRQDEFETVINFIISSNNNIPRIKGIIDRICSALGTDMDGYYAFPTIEQMATVGKEFYSSIGAGYRGAYLYNTVQAIANGYDLSVIKDMDTEIGRKHLLGLSGIGPKVADCILLFAYHRMDVFPVDTWIEKVYKDECKQCASNKTMTHYLVGKYGNLSGYAQQYLFYYKRTSRIDNKSKI